MNKTLLGGLALAGLATAVTAFAQPAPDDAAPKHRAGRSIGRAAFMKRVEDRFARLDANHDGFIDRGEAGPAAQAGSRPGLRTRIDPNASFDAMDANHDGSISRDEYLAARGRRAAGPAGGGNAAARARRAGLGIGFSGRWFDRVDSDGDGRVSLAEAQRAAGALFDRIDSNHDGAISPEERAAARHGFRVRRSDTERGR
ncbi:MAG TPA: EF-hand domain-containing protein [Allosphingosinicella sp.]|nr:EF-hand domain-containing protein [Allosphingosinicella sp.]